MDGAAEEFVRQGVFSEEARRERQQVEFYPVDEGRPDHVPYVEHADHRRPELEHEQVASASLTTHVSHLISYTFAYIYIYIVIHHNMAADKTIYTCLLYTSPSPRDRTRYRMPSSA